MAAQTTKGLKASKKMLAGLTFRVPSHIEIKSVINVRSPQLDRAFHAMGSRLHGGALVEIAYHGTSAAAAKNIATNGFKAPLDDPRLAHSSGNNGWYGNGIYLSPRADVALNYCRDNLLLVCSVLRGRVFKCQGMMMGAPLVAGYDSHMSPDGVEWVFYSSAQVLPIALVSFCHRTDPYRYGEYTTFSVSGTADKGSLARKGAPARDWKDMSNSQRKALRKEMKNDPEQWMNQKGRRKRR